MVWPEVIYGLFAFIGAVLAIEGENKLPATIQNAQSTPIFSRAAQYFAKLMPVEINKKLSSNLINHTGEYTTASEKIEKMKDNGARILKKPLELLNDEKPD